MDCKTARQTLDFARPRRPELESADLEALESHLADCPECGPLAQTERQMDTRLAQAMRSVPVPEGLHLRLLARLETERKTQNRRWRRRIAIPAAAAALVLALGLGWKLLQKPEHIYATEIAQEAADRMFNPHPWAIENYFSGQGIRTVAPADANYTLLHHYGVAPFQGERVPFLLFTDGRNDVHVFILRTKDFDVDEAARNQQMVGSGWKTVIRYDPSGNYGYLVIYLGDGALLKVFPDKASQPEI
jgi:hypothetical protein